MVVIDKFDWLLFGVWIVFEVVVVIGDEFCIMMFFCIMGVDDDEFDCNFDFVFEVGVVFFEGVLFGEDYCFYYMIFWCVFYELLCL